MFDTALQLRAGVRAYLACDPRERAGNKEAVRSLNAAHEVISAGGEGRRSTRRGIAALPR